MSDQGAPHAPLSGDDAVDFEFDVATRIQTTDANSASAVIDRGWTVADKPNGGYLLALMARSVGAALAHAGSPHRDPLAATAHYLRAPSIGAVEIDTEVFRAGRGASQARATLRQDEKACVDATFTMATLEPDPAPPWWSDRSIFDVAPIEECRRLPAAREGAPFEVPIMDRSDLRLDPAVLGWTAGQPSGRADLRGWISFADGRPADPLGLLFFVDSLPPATFGLVETGWVPTLSLTAYVRARPAPGPLRIRQTAHSIDGNRVDETCEIWDSTHRLVAQATQLAAIRIPDGARPPNP